MSSNCVLKSNHGSFGGEVLLYSHASIFTKTTMNFSIFLPPKDNGEKVPVLIYLAGLTCTDETFMIKSAAQEYASTYRIANIVQIQALEKLVFMAKMLIGLSEQVRAYT